MKIPDGLIAHKMTGGALHVTQHAKERFEERTGVLDLTCSEIAERCIGDPRAVWEGHTLVTYLQEPRMAKQSLASQTPGALAKPLTLPSVFGKPSAPIAAKQWPPYVVFAHPKRADEWKKIQAAIGGQPPEGDMFFVHGDRVVHLPKMKCAMMACRQYWAEANPAGEVLRTSWDERPGDFKEHVEAVLLVYVEGDALPANIRFKTTRCPAAKMLQDALALATDDAAWSKRSQSHQVTLSIVQPFGRYIGVVELSPPRMSRSSGLPYRTTSCEVLPTGPDEWKALKALGERQDVQKLMEDAAASFEFRIKEVEAKLAK